ncbi:MAG: transglycosylase domain-containing protein, partial [Acidobacteria bacterium]|nr:transglycosylase domain-containing protein [Acidobacteriota bacterium]
MLPFKRSARPLLWLAALVGALVQGTLVAQTQWTIHGVLTGLPSRAELRTIGQMAQATVLYDAADHPAFSIFEEQRLEVPLAAISPHLVSAIVAVEDQRFYDHSGVDAIR